MKADVLGVALGGALGALARMLMTRFLEPHNPHAAFSIGILAANILGCFLMGFLAVRVQALEPPMREAMGAFLLTGFLGALTTYSTFTLELFKLGESAMWKLGALYAGVHFIFGLLGLWLGTLLAGWTLKT